MSQQPNKPIPEWRRRLIEEKRFAKTRWWESLSDEDRAEAAQAQKEFRVALRDRAKTKDAYYRTVVSMMASGASVDEIATSTGRPVRSVYDLLARLGVPVSVGEPRVRAPIFFASHRAMAEVCSLAADRGETVAWALTTLVEAAMADGGLIARRTLGMKRRQA